MQSVYGIRARHEPPQLICDSRLADAQSFQERQEFNLREPDIASARFHRHCGIQLRSDTRRESRSVRIDDRSHFGHARGITQHSRQLVAECIDEPLRPTRANVRHAS